MSKWSEDFEKQFKEVGRLKKLSKQLEKNMQEEDGYETLKEFKRRFKK